MKSKSERMLKSGIMWTAGVSLLNNVSQFGIAILLARLLSPEDFGAMAMVMIVTAIGTCLAGAGFGQAIIQKDECSEPQLSSVFWFSLCVSIVLAIGVCAGATSAAEFLTMPVLSAILPLASVSLILSGLQSVHSALLARRLEFRVLAQITAVATVLSGAVALGLAFTGFGIWSLVWQQIAFGLASVACLWYKCKWRPRCRGSLRCLKPHARFGVYIAGANLLETVFGRLNAIAIGKVFSATELGFYTRAESFRALPTNLVLSIIDRVAFPVFSRDRGNPFILLRGYQKAASVAVFISAPIMVGLSLRAEPIVDVLLGSKWEASASILAILAIGGLFYIPHSINTSLIKAIGAPQVFFKIEIIKKVLLVSAVVIGIQFNVLVMAWGQVAVTTITFAMSSAVCIKNLNISVRELVDVMARPVLPSLVLGLWLWIAQSVMPIEVAWQELSVSCVTGAIVFLVAGLCFKSRELSALVRYLRYKNER